MNHFANPGAVVRSLEADPSTTDQPIKRTFLFDGEFVTANLAVIDTDEDTLHTQPHHDEIVMVVEGEADFRVGDETRRVGPGHLVFIPRNTIHGPIVEAGQRFAAISVFAPYFDRSPKNFEWQRDRTEGGRA
jgi:mannose-6-phosphate isomerase-like protein (cupin superfamily)